MKKVKAAIIGTGFGHYVIVKAIKRFANFQIDNKPFYVHTEPEIFKDRILLAKLLGTHIT